VSAVMTRIYLEVVTTENPLVRLNLLQLVETRARRWRHDSAAENFYANRKLNLSEKVCIQSAYHCLLISSSAFKVVDHSYLLTGLHLF
jgi:hypothetical protein